jgi:hypothetical protein
MMQRVQVCRLQDAAFCQPAIEQVQRTAVTEDFVVICERLS